MSGSVGAQGMNSIARPDNPKLLEKKMAQIGVRLEFGNYPTLSALSLTGDFVPLSVAPDRKGCTE